MVTALALLSTAPLRLTLVLPPQIKPGEKVEARVVVKNLSNRPLTLVLPKGENVLVGMSVDRRIVGSGGAVVPDEKGPLMGQWTTDGRIHPESFTTLRPGESRELYHETFSRRFLGERPSLISEYAKAPRADLAPGKYRYRFLYRLEPKVPSPGRVYGVRGRPATVDRGVFAPGTRARFDACWRGKVATEGTFEVRA